MNWKPNRSAEANGIHKKLGIPPILLVSTQVKIFLQ